MADQWFPGENEITSTGLPMSYQGKLYFPVTTETEYPTIYIIDPVTFSASKGIKVTYAGSIVAIGRLAK